MGANTPTEGSLIFTRAPETDLVQTRPQHRDLLGSFSVGTDRYS